MSHSRLGATARLAGTRHLNCRVGRVIAIPQPVGTNPLAQFEMLDDIPPVHILAEAFDREFHATRHSEIGRLLDFEAR